MNRYRLPTPIQTANNPMRRRNPCLCPQGRRPPAAFVIYCAAAITLLAGCASYTPAPGNASGAAKPSTSETARSVSVSIDAAAQDVERAKQTVDQATPDNLAQKKPIVGEQLNSAARNLSNAKSGTSEVLASATNDMGTIDALTQENARLKEADELRWYLRATAYALLVGGVICAVLSIKLDMLREIAGGAIAAGLGIAAIEWYLDSIRLVVIWAIIALILGAGIAMAVKAWRGGLLKARAKAIVDSIDQAVNAGAIKWDSAADDIVNQVQDSVPGTKALVDQLQGKSTGKNK